VRPDPPGADGSNPGRGEDLARQANRVRRELLGTIEQLGHRRQNALDLGRQLRRHARQLLLIGGVLVVVTAGAAALAVHRIATAPSRRRRDRWRLAKSVWRHPERALRGERGTVARKVLRSLLISVLTALVTIPARRAVLALLPAVPSGEHRPQPEGTSG
jgi:hypothetical protein